MIIIIIIIIIIWKFKWYVLELGDNSIYTDMSLCQLLGNNIYGVMVQNTGIRS